MALVLAEGLAIRRERSEVESASDRESIETKMSTVNNYFKVIDLNGRLYGTWSFDDRNRDSIKKAFNQARARWHDLHEQERYPIVCWRKPGLMQRGSWDVTCQEIFSQCYEVGQ